MLIKYRKYPNSMSVFFCIRIIERTNLLGHFQLVTIVSRLKQKHHWTRMSDDTIRVIHQCLVCKRHQNQAALEYPARSLPIKGIFDHGHSSGIWTTWNS